MTATWTKYLHDDVPGFGPMPHGLMVSWSDQRDHGTETFLPSGERLNRDGFAFNATVELAVKLAEVMVDNGMTEVQIGGLLEHEAKAVLDVARFSRGYRYEASYCHMTGLHYLDVTNESEVER